jgi:hypothetical protein
VARATLRLTVFFALRTRLGITWSEKMKHASFIFLAMCLLASNTAFSEDNENAVRKSITDSYQTVKWGTTIDYAEYLKFVSSIPVGPPAIAAYFVDLLGSVASDGAEIALDDAYKMIKGEKSEIISGKNTVYVGVATINHWRTVGVTIAGREFEKKAALPNTFIFYVAINRKPDNGELLPEGPDCQLFVVDMDGDGKADRTLITGDGRWHVLTAQGENGVPTIPWGSTIPGWTGKSKIYLGDFDGDGKADRALVQTKSSDNSDGAWHVVSTATGSPGLPGIPWGSLMNQGIPAAGRFFIDDFDNDKKVDRATISITSPTDSDGTWFIVSSSTLGEPVAGLYGTKMAPGMPADGRYFVGHFDNDRIADRMFINSAGAVYVVSSAAGPQTPGWQSGERPANGSPTLAGAQFFVADVNGDKRADLIFVTPNGKWHALSGTDAGIEEPGFGYASAPPGWPGNGRFFVADFDGDGKADRAFLRPDGAWHVISTATGVGGTTAIPWGSQPLGWPKPSAIRE